MRVLVAGGAGYIGSCTTEYLLDHGHDVYVIDSLVHGYRRAVDSRAGFTRIDLADRETLIDLVSQMQPDGVIHFGAFIEVGESMKEPGMYFRNNVACSLNLLDAALESCVPKIVFSSTAAVYGHPARVPITEDEPTQPINPYGESKWMVERILSWYYRIHGLEYVALRYFNAAGASRQFGEWHKPETHLIPNVLRAAAGNGDQVQIFGDDYPTADGTCVRDYIHVVDLAQAHLRALESGFSGSYNVGSGCGYTVKEVIEATERVTARQVPHTVVPRREGDPPKLVSDPGAACRDLGWQPQYNDIRSIIQSAWDWFCEHPHGYDADGE